MVWFLFLPFSIMHAIPDLGPYMRSSLTSHSAVQVIDPTQLEESVMTGRMTATLNANGDVCAIQKAGGEGVYHRVIMHCLQLARAKAGDITTKIKNEVSFPS